MTCCSMGQNKNRWQTNNKKIKIVNRKLRQKKTSKFDNIDDKIYEYSCGYFDKKVLDFFGILYVWWFQMTNNP